MRSREILLWLSVLSLAPVLSCGDDEGTGPGTAGPATLAKVGGDGGAAEVGTPVPEDPTIEVRDASGDPVPGETVEFSVTSGGGSVSPSATTSDSRGRASATWTLGTSSSATQTLEARLGSLTATFAATAEPGPVAGVRIVDGDDQVVESGGSLDAPLVVRVVDRFGNGVPDVTVSFEAETGSVSPAETTTDGSGEAQATATVGALGELGDEVSVLPVSLARGRESLAYGASLRSARTTGFTAGATGAGSVDFDAHVPSGASAEWSVADGSPPPGLSVTQDGSITGTPDGQGLFDFTVEAREQPNGPSGSRSYTLQICGPPLQLSAGQAHSSAPPPSGECGIFLPSGAEGDRYRVAVSWPSSVSGPDGPKVTLEVRGHGIAVTTRPPRVAAASLTRPSPALPFRRLQRDLERLEATADLHRRLLEEGALLAARLGPSALPPEGSAASRAPARTHSADEMRTFSAPVNSCSAAGELRAELLVESDELLVYQDSAQHASMEQRVDTTLARRMTDYYRDYGKQVIEDYFGGVSDIDGNGKVIVLVAPAPLIDSGDALAFVLSRDFFAPDQCAGSNEAEITYFSADGINAMESGADPPSFQALGALVHEVKHISSFHNRIQAQDLTQRPTWIEEGTADIAAELSSRIAWSATGGPAEDQTVTGESFGDLDVTLSPENWGILLRMARTVAAWATQPNSLTNNPVPAHSFRGSSWHFHRFLADAYAGGIPSDADFFRQQNARDAEPGVGFYRGGLVGKAYPTLVEEHAVATMVNGTAAEASVERTFTGYSFPSAAEIFCSPNPLGVYPWPVTTTGTREQGACENGFAPDAEVQDPSASFATNTFEGPLGRGGMRIHDFLSDGSGQGAEINVGVEGPARDQARVIVVRIR